MSVTVVDNELPPEAADPSVKVVARVLLSIDGSEEWFEFTLKPFPVGAETHRLVQPDPALFDRFRNQHTTVHRVSKLIGRAARTGDVHLPQRVAA